MNSDDSQGEFVYEVGVMVGKYRLEERLGGNQQLIFRGVDSRDQKTVAIKVFVNSLNNDLVHKAYYNEIWARDLAKSIPGVLKIIGKGIHNRSEYFVTEYIETGNLSTVLKQNPNISLPEAILLFSPIADALDELHKRGVIHRDVKPENILVRKKDEKWEIFIIDFGDARFSHELDGTYITDSIAGTPLYIAPEVFSITPKSILVDNFSFGVMLYIAFEGRAPFTKVRISNQDTDLDREPVSYPEQTQIRYTKGVADLIMWAISDSPEERPETTIEIIQLLTKIDQTIDDDDKKWISCRFRNYLVLDVLYKGRIFSPSLLALDVKTKGKVVLKTFVRRSLVGNAKSIYDNEVNSLNRLEGEHCVVLPKETFDQDGIFFIVTDYHDGGSLRSLLETKPDINTLLNIFSQVADAIDHIHKKGLVHRDIKPENIVYHISGGMYHAYLTDFGTAKILENASLSFTTQYQQGTGLYMAPEVWREGARKTKAIDIYAFGIMLYEAFEGRLPFTGNDWTHLSYQHNQVAVPPFEKEVMVNNPKASEIILHMLAKDPNARPKSALKEVKKLKRLLTQTIKEKKDELFTDPARVMPKEEHPGETKKEPPEEPKRDEEKGIRWLPVALMVLIAFICIGSIFPLSKLLWTLTSSPTPTITPTSFTTFEAIVSQPSFCHNGPNESYLEAIDIASGTKVEVLGMNSDEGDWFMIRGTDIDPCWIKVSRLTLSPDVDIEKIYVFTTVFTIGNTPCLKYPEAGNTVQTVIPTERRVVLYGKSDPEATWVMVVPHNSTKLCWVKKTTLAEFDPAPLLIEVASLDIPNLETIVTSTATAIATSTATATSTNRPVFTPVVPTKTRDSGGGNDPTPIPPTNTPIPPTPIPPTNTPIPPTPIPPTNTPVPPTPIPATPTLCWPPGKCR